MATITAPNKDYSGPIHGALFVNGVASRVNPDLVPLDWFKRKGYGISFDDLDPAEAKEAFEASIEPSPSAPIEDAGESRGMTDEQRREHYGQGVGFLAPPSAGSPSSAPVIAPGIVATERSLSQRKSAKGGGKKSTAKKSTRKSTRKSSRKSTARKSTARKATGGSTS